MRSVRGSSAAWSSLKAKRKPKQQMKCYEQRKFSLIAAGFTSSYPEYLKSDVWKEIRRSKLARFPHCLICNKAATVVHHLAYSPNVLLGLCPKQLVTLCDNCHTEIEFDGKRKCDLKEANHRLRQLAHKNNKHKWLSSIKGIQARTATPWKTANWKQLKI